MRTVPEKIKYLYDHLPDRYIAWQMVEEASIIVGVRPERAEQYLRMLEVFRMVRRIDNMGTFEKVEKGQKKVKLEDMDFKEEE